MEAVLLDASRRGGHGDMSFGWVAALAAPTKAKNRRRGRRYHLLCGAYEWPSGGRTWGTAERRVGRGTRRQGLSGKRLEKSSHARVLSRRQSRRAYPPSISRRRREEIAGSPTKAARLSGPT